MEYKTDIQNMMFKQQRPEFKISMINFKLTTELNNVTTVFKQNQKYTL